MSTWYSNFKEQEIYEEVGNKLNVIMESGIIDEEDADEFLLDEEISEMSAQELDDFLSDFIYEAAETYVLDSLKESVVCGEMSEYEAIDLIENQEFMASAIIDAIEEGTLSPPEAGADEKAYHSGEYDEIQRNSPVHDIKGENRRSLPSGKETPAAGHGGGAGGTIGPKAILDRIEQKKALDLKNRAYETKGDPGPEDIKEDAVTKVLRRVYGDERYPY